MRFRRVMTLEPLEVRRLCALAVTPYDPDLPISELTDALIVPQTGINIAQATYVGQNGQAGTYSGLHLASGQNLIDLNDGVLLTTGLAANAVGPNSSSAATQPWNASGDADMDAAIGGGYSTFDADSLTIDFTIAGGTQSIAFDLLFGSEEFPEFTGASDAFGAFLDGQQICFDANGDLTSVSSAFLAYDNTGQGVLGKTPVSMDIQYDGLTAALHVIAPLDPMATNHTLKLVIADTGDSSVDSGVFLARLMGDTASPSAPSTSPVPASGASAFNFLTGAQTFADTDQFLPVTIQRNGDLSAAATVDYFTMDGTAVNGFDYEPSSGTISFGPNEPTKTIFIAVYENPAAPSSLTFSIQLTSPSVGTAVGAVPMQTVTLTNSRSVAEFSVSEIPAAADAGMVVIEVRRTGNLANAATVNYATADDSAVAGVDYFETHGTLNFAPGESVHFIVVALPHNPNTPEGATFSVHLSSPGGSAVLGELINAWVHLQNNYSLVQWSTAANAFDRASGQATLTLTRTGRTDLFARVTFGTGDASAVAGIDYIASSGEVDFAPGETTKTVTVGLINDRTRPTSVDFNVILASGSTNTIVGTLNTTTVAVQNAGSVFQFLRRSLAVRAADGTVDLTVQRVGDLSEPASVAYATQTGTAVAGVDYVPTGGVIAFARGEATHTISIHIAGGADRPARSIFAVVLALASPGAVVGDGRAASITLLNERSLVQFATPTYSVAESEKTVALSLNRTGDLSDAAKVAYRAVGGSALSGVDYADGEGTIEFAAGQKTATIQLQINQDAVVEPAETIQIELSSLTNGVAIGDAARAAVTITDVTAPPTIEPINPMISTGGGSKVQSLSLSFDQPLMSAPPLTAFTLVKLTPGKPGAIWRGKPITLKDIEYDPTTHTASVVPVKGLDANVLYQLTVASDQIQNLSGQSSSQSDGPAIFRFGHGRKLQYADADGDRVSIKLSGPGDLSFFSSGDVTRLSVTGVAERTTLSGAVQRVRDGSSDGRTTLATIVGLAADHWKLPTDQFSVDDES